MNISFIGFAVLFLAIKASDAFWGLIFSRFWKWLFEQIDWQKLTTQLKLKLLLLYLDWLIKTF